MYDEADGPHTASVRSEMLPELHMVLPATTSTPVASSPRSRVPITVSVTTGTSVAASAVTVTTIRPCAVLEVADDFTV
ncbi:hypothetical protein D3C81_2200040 [compost metagenome]